MAFGCEFAICVTSGEGFEKGKIYPILGTNNGIHILRRGDDGDPYDFIAASGGIGEGLFNNWDDSGAPSFNEIIIN